MPTTDAWAGMVARARRIHLQFTSIVALALNTRFFGLRTYAFFSFLAAVGWSMLKRTALSRLPGLAAKSAWRARAQVKNRQRALLTGHSCHEDTDLCCSLGLLLEL